MQDIGRVAVLGAGNIGLAIAEGIASSWDFGMTGESVVITRRNTSFTCEEEERFDCFTDNRKAVSQAKIVIIAPRPDQVDDLLNEIADVLEGQLLISVVSGLSIERIQKLTGRGPVVRAMLNIAVQVSQSMICVAFSEEALAYAATVAAIFSPLGEVLMISEERVLEATVFCGSEIAFALRSLDTHVRCCERAGFTRAEAMLITTQVTKGALALFEKSQGNPESDIARVSTKGGCTVAMLEELEQGGFRSLIQKALETCLQKARKLYS